MTLALLLATFLTTAEIDREYHCAAQIAYHEARGEASYLGKRLPVIIAGNRVLHSEFPNTMCGVMTEHNQFTFVSNGLNHVAPNDYVAWERSKIIAHEIMNQEISNDNVGLNGALFFQTTNLPNWNPRRLRELGVVGNHRYYNLK